VIVSNEGEEDGTNEIARKWTSLTQCRVPVQLIENDTNLGFGPSCNQGIRRLYEDEKINTIGVFNVDQEVREDWLYWLLRALQYDERIGMATSSLIEGTSPEQFRVARFDDISPGSPMTILHRSKGCPWIFPRHVLEEIGLFDEQFAYSQSEDSDMCLRIARAGWDFVIVQNSRAFHYVGSEGQVAARVATGRDFASENMHKFVSKWGTWDMDEVMPKFYRPLVEEIL
jgi:GT2 family glycosyltransferase